jgi:hypothetical protein
MSLQNFNRDDPSFPSDLEESQIAVWRVARWLVERGNNVTVRATHVRDTLENMADFSDEGDIEIVQRVEVKRRPDIEFRSRETFPYDSIIVDVAHAWDRARPKPFTYIILNASRTYAAIVRGETFKWWTKTKKRDRFKKRDRTFYECPIEHVTFISLADTE